MSKWVLSVACIWFPLAWCIADDASLTIVGRRGAAQEIGKGGVTREIPKSQLQFLNQSRGAGQAPRVVTPSEKADKDKDKDGLKKAAVPAKPAEKELTPAEKARLEAARKENIEHINRVRQLGGWIYDKDNKPLSNEELNDRIKSGNLDDIKMIDKFQQQSKTVSAADALKGTAK